MIAASTESDESNHRRPAHYPFLDGIRGLTAAYVMVFHLAAWVPSVLPRWITRLQRPLSFGHVAVSVFIVLSGFSLGLPVARSTDRVLRGGIRGYLVRRAKRILPAYYAALCLGIAAVAAIHYAADPSATNLALSPGSILSHVLLVHNLSNRYLLTINMAMWSVAAEWQIYFIFPLVLIPAWRKFGRLASLGAAVGLSAAPLLLLPPERNFSWTCPWYITLFAMGLVASTLEFRRPTPSIRVWLLSAALLLATTYLLIYHHFHRFGSESAIAEFLKDSCAGVLVATVLIYGTLDWNQTKNPRRPLLLRVLESRGLRAAGKISYSLYLVHCTILTLCLWAAMHFGMRDLTSFSLRVFAGIPASVLIAMVFYALFERPWMTRGSRVKSAPAL